ncbi:undecaprenyl-diphosphate phosphatase [Acidicapsa dinghuensis]|uniref:Undecaprenyl-diphosphatase n=1 Tax=Acidicapsa dinghuensis TaxID=2218256 RepID=A0ABW1E935_9BACT|nr:undecaprenyl-diphosphate phosphatase [Acidicapsa dinghuensis]
MPIWKVILLAIVQGLAELLPVSSSAHVIVAEKLMGLDPSAPQMTLLLVMLHTGTMFAVIVYFWRTWKEAYFSSSQNFNRFAGLVIWATILTGIVGEALKKLIEKTLFAHQPKAEIENLFSRLDLIAPALAAAGLLILISGLMERRQLANRIPSYAAFKPESEGTVNLAQTSWMGIVQGLALPFRGFSRSGSTISTAMLAGAKKAPAERFSFAMAVVLTPVVVGMELLRLEKAHTVAISAGSPAGSMMDLHGSLLASLLGMVFSFLAGLVALRWLSSWLENGRWYLFGIYCLVASAGVFALYLHGF